MTSEVKATRKRGTTKISSKHQVTIPVDAMEQAGLHAGDRVQVRTEGRAVILEPEMSAVDKVLGSFVGVWDGFDLDALRDEWV